MPERALIDLSRPLHPGMPVFQISAKTGEGFDAWLAWLKTQVAEKQKS